jgi:hypothetical protein
MQRHGFKQVKKLSYCKQKYVITLFVILSTLRIFFFFLYYLTLVEAVPRTRYWSLSGGDSPKLLHVAVWQLLSQLGSKILAPIPFCDR